MNHKVKNIVAFGTAILASVFLSGCIIAPLRVASPLQVTVEDAETGRPISDAKIVYIVSDIHDALCKNGRVIRTKTDNNGAIDISGRRKWGFWIVAPGGLPAPQHIFSVSAPGYSSYVFGRPDEMLSRKRLCCKEHEIMEALGEIPQEKVFNDTRLIPLIDLNHEKIKLTRIEQ